MKSCFVLVVLICSLSGQQARYNGCIFKGAKSGSTPILQSVNVIPLAQNDPIRLITEREIVMIQNCFVVYPVFWFFDDREGNNALATDEVTHQNGPDGTIIFGKRLFNRELLKTFGGTTIPIVIAHEYAHIVDYKYGVLEHVGSKKEELFADYMAGCYMYHRVANNILTDVGACLKSFESLGDTDFGSRTHHGTPTERRNALVAGYNKAMEHHRSQNWTPLTTIIDDAKTYIQIHVKDVKDPDVKEPE